MNARDNTWLMVRQPVRLTDIIDPVIMALDVWYRMYECRSYVTSGLRTPRDQFAIIQRAAIDHGLQKEFPKIIGANIDTLMIIGGQTQPVWLGVWSRLLAIGYLVNPPKPACVLFDYVHPGTGKKIPAGTLIQPSPHFKGTAFDIGGAGESADKTIQDELDIIQEAIKSTTIPELVSITIERENNCIHCDCKRV